MHLEQRGGARPSGAVRKSGARKTLP